MSPWLFNVYMNGVMKEVKIGMGRRGMRFLENGRDWRLPGLLYADDLVLCGESMENLRAMAGCFAKVCRRRGLKVNSGKSKVIDRNGKEGLEHVSEFKFLRCVLDKPAKMKQSVVSGRSVTDSIRSLVKARDMQLVC